MLQNHAGVSIRTYQDYSQFFRDMQINCPENVTIELIPSNQLIEENDDTMLQSLSHLTYRIKIQNHPNYFRFDLKSLCLFLNDYGKEIKYIKLIFARDQENIYTKFLHKQIQFFENTYISKYCSETIAVTYSDIFLSCSYYSLMAKCGSQLQQQNYCTELKVDVINYDARMFTLSCEGKFASDNFNWHELISLLKLVGINIQVLSIHAEAGFRSEHSYVLNKILRIVQYECINLKQLAITNVQYTVEFEDTFPFLLNIDFRMNNQESTWKLQDNQSIEEIETQLEGGKFSIHVVDISSALNDHFGPNHFELILKMPNLRKLTMATYYKSIPNWQNQKLESKLQKALKNLTIIHNGQTGSITPESFVLEQLVIYLLNHSERVENLRIENYTFLNYDNKESPRTTMPVNLILKNCTFPTMINQTIIHNFMESSIELLYDGMNPVSNGQFLQNTPPENLTAIAITNCFSDVTDEDLGCIYWTCPNIQKFTIENCYISDSFFMHITLCRITELNLNKCTIKTLGLPQFIIKNTLCSEQTELAFNENYSVIYEVQIDNSLNGKYVKIIAP